MSEFLVYEFNQFPSLQTRSDMCVESLLLKVSQFIFNFFKNRKEIQCQVNGRRWQKLGEVPNETRTLKKENTADRKG